LAASDRPRPSSGQSSRPASTNLLAAATRYDVPSAPVETGYYSHYYDGPSVSAASGYYDRYYDYSYRPQVGYHYVQGYYRADGTHVSGHYRINHDDSFWNNWSSQGNVNLFTGRVGTKQPPYPYRHRR